MYDLYRMQPVLYYQENIPLAIVLGDQEKERFGLGKYFKSLYNNVKQTKSLTSPSKFRII
jgi:hypothetical protein